MPGRGRGASDERQGISFPPSLFFSRSGIARIVKKEHFHPAAGFLCTQQSGREDAAVVPDQQITWPQVVDNIRKPLVAQPAADRIQYHKPGIFPLVGRLLGDQLGWKVIIVRCESQVFFHGIAKVLQELCLEQATR
jgi:hypothetical protein